MSRPFRVAQLAAALALVLPAAASAAVTPIHDVQGNGMASPLAGQVVTVDGVVTGVTDDGLFLQSAAADADADPATSEGVFVHTGSRPDDEIFVGDRVRASGTVE